MTRPIVPFALALLICAGAHAATINTLLTVDATASLGASITATGTATLTNIGNGTFSGALSLTPDASGNLSATFTITLSGGGGTLTGKLLIPPAVLSGEGTGSATITGGTGPYASATGSFPSLAGTGSTGASGITLHFSGKGTVNTSGSGGGPTGPPAPTITEVLDAGSYTANIAQGSVFVVKGSNLSPTGFNQYGFPLPTNSNGVKITFTPVTSAAGTDVYLVYTYNQNGVNQLAAILPSTVAPGSYNVTVTNNGTASAPFLVTVVQRKIGLITRNSAGDGLAVIQNYISATQLDVDAYTTGTVSGTTISPAKPGQILIAWATGFGPVTGGDNVASPGFNFAANGVTVQVIVGGMTITPAYAGRAPGLAGTDQINFTLPANVPTGCTVSFQVSVNGVMSNPTYISIAPDASSSACVLPGFTTSQLQGFDQNPGAVYQRNGNFSISQISQTVSGVGTVKIDSANGAFTQYTNLELAGIPPSTSQITTSGACIVIQVSGSQSQLGGGTGTNLDAGAMTLNGPAGSNISNMAFTQSPSNSYSLTIATEGISLPGGSNAKLTAGTYTLSGAGGTQVGKVNASIALGTPLSITGGLPSSVNRSQDLTINWTGGNPSDVVQITGYSGATSGSGQNTTINATEFICTTTAAPGTFTVKSSILSQLPQVSASAISSGNQIGFLAVYSSPNPTTFSAPLVAGGAIDNSTFAAFVGTGTLAAYQ
jgi:uncharacterized protein (TIGR03437 family)